MPCNLNQRDARGVREGGDPRGGRHADRVQHDLGLRRRLDGHRGDARLARLARGDRRLDRARRRGHLFDGLVCLVGCDKTIPGAVMALARLDIPGLVLYNGSIAPGRFRGRDVTIQDVFEAVGAHAAGKMTRRGAARARGRRVPRRRRVRRPVHREHDGDGARLPRDPPVGPERHPGAAPGKDEAADEAGRLVMDARAHDVAPVADPHARGVRERDRGGRRDRRLDERRPAPARDRARVGVPLAIDDFDTIAAGRRSSPT